MDDADKLNILKAISGVPEGSFFADPKRVKGLEAEGLIEGNSGMKNPKNPKEQAYRLTAAGTAYVAAGGPGESTEEDDDEVSAFVIAKVAIPTIGRLNSGPSKYPFDKLDNGFGFFIPAPAGMKSPSKSFGSMVSAANKKYGTQADFRRFTTRSMDGAPFGKAGVKGVGVFRVEAEDEAKAKAKAAA